jgi:hypothetical protein
MAISIDLGSGPGSTNGDTLYEAFTKVNNMFSTTTKLSNGDLTINGVKVGKANNYGSTAVGEFALNVNTSNGIDNTAVGWSALASNTVGDSNVAVGTNALTNNVAGICNTAVGCNALLGNNSIDAGANTAIGYASLSTNTIGGYNTAVGHFSLNKNESGNRNVAVGFVALENNTSGSNNVGIGEYALNYNQTGVTNTAIGTDALYLSTTHSNSTGLGYNAQVEGSNQIQLGSGATTCYTNGAVQNRSDLRDKAEVRDTVLGLDFINELRPVDYKWDMREDYRAEKLTPLELNATDEEKEAYKILTDEWLESVKLENITHDGTHTRTRYHHGLIAQEVQDVIDASGVDFGGFQDHKVNGGGDVLSIGYTELIAPMIKAIQELTARINVLEGN